MNRFMKAGPLAAREFLFAKYGKGGIVDAIRNAFKMTDAAPDPSRRGTLGLREQITQPGALTTVEKEVSASDLDTLQKALGAVGDSILNQPVTRRDVLKRGALSTASDLLPAGGVLPQVVKAAASKMTPVEPVATGLQALTPEQVDEIVELFNASGSKRTEKGIEKFFDYGGFDAIDEALIAANKLADYPDDADKMYGNFLNLANAGYGEVRDAILASAKNKKKTEPAIATMYGNERGGVKGLTQKEVDDIVNDFVEEGYAATDDDIDSFMDNYGFEAVDEAIAARNKLSAGDLEKDEVLELMNADYQSVMDAIKRHSKQRKKKD